MVLALPKKRGEKNSHGTGPGLHRLSKVAEIGRVGEEDMANGERMPRRVGSSLSTWTLLDPKWTKSHVMPDEQQWKGIRAVGLQLVLGQRGGVKGMCRKMSGERLIAGKVQVWAPLIDGMLAASSRKDYEEPTAEVALIVTSPYSAFRCLTALTSLTPQHD